MSQRSRTDVLPLAPANGPHEDEVAHAGAGSSARPLRDPISPFVHDVLELFEGPLGEVRFPDADRASLTQLADAANEAQCEVEALEAALEAARARARAAQETLGDHASRALAYARVFAMGQPSLENAVSAVRTSARTESRERDTKSPSSSGAIEGEAPRRRGRPRKSVGEPMLPIDEPVAIDEPAAIGAAE
ncbi:MAG: hypothetical protein U0353_25035 [Sandaracinus sp.]|jgi:hypothetical protein